MAAGTSKLQYHFYLLGLFIELVCTLYNGDVNVVELTDANFKSRVLDSSNVWIVEFYAPWCGHCKSFAIEYKKAAKVLKGMVSVGAIDMTQSESIGQQYGIQGFPTIKIFGGNKQKPIDFNGARTTEALSDAAINEMKKVITSRLGVKDSGGSGSGGGQKSGANKVIELTDSNFNQMVMNSKDIWMVEFYAPWCGHCKNLEPHWREAASQLDGKVKLGALDATVYQAIASRYQIKGFPTIKFFAPGSSSENDAEDYGGGRTSADIVQWAMQKASENAPAPEVLEGISQTVFDDACNKKQLCIISMLPDILDCQSKCRNDYIKMLKDLAEKFKKNAWGWVWLPAGEQPKLEEALGMGGFGYPAMAAVNYRKMKFAVLKGSFGQMGIYEFLRDLSYGKGQTAPINGAEFPKVKELKPWDGKDGVMPVVEDIDLSDIELDDIPKTEL